MCGERTSLNYVTSVAPETPTQNAEREISFSGNLYDIVVDRSRKEDSLMTEWKNPLGQKQNSKSLKTKYEPYVKYYNKDLKEWETKKGNLEEKEKTEKGKLLSKGGIYALKSEDVPKTKDESIESNLTKLREEVEATMTEVVKKMLVKKSQSFQRGNGGRRGRVRIFKVCWKKGFLGRVEKMGEILGRLLLFFASSFLNS